MGNLRNIIKQYKWIFIALFTALILLVLYFLLRGLGAKKAIEPSNNTGSLNMLNVSPPSGLNTNIDLSSPIIFHFNKPIDPLSVKVISVPYINLKASVPRDDPTYLWVTPLKQLWQTNVVYNIVISKGLKAVDGSVLNEEIKYVYLANPPKDIMGGEGPKIP